MFKSLPLRIGVVDVDGVDGVDTEGVVAVLEYLPHCLDVVGLDGVDGVFEEEFLDSYLIHCNDFLPYVNN